MLTRHTTLERGVGEQPVIRERLSATTHTEAKAQVRQKWAELEARLNQLRSGASSSEVSEEDIARYAAAFLASHLEEDEDYRVEGLSERDYRKYAESIDISDAGGRHHLARGNTSTIEFEMEDFLEHRFGVRLQKGTATYRAAAYAFMRATVKGTEMVAARHRGEIVDTPKVELPVATKNAARTGAPLLSEVSTYFLGNYDQRKPMYRKYAAVLPMFVECIGDKPVDQLKQMDIEDFFKMICRLPPRWADELRRRKVRSPKELDALDHAKTMAPKTYEDTYIAAVRPFLSTSASRILHLPHRARAAGGAQSAELANR